MEQISIKEIVRILPHRYPFLLLDRVTELVVNKMAMGIKNVTINEPFFQGHFPAEPVMPGVLILESMAQLAAVLAYVSIGEEGRGKLLYFAGIDGVRFRLPVIPGDQLLLQVVVTKKRLGLWKMEAEAHVGGFLVAEAQLMATIQ